MKTSGFNINTNEKRDRLLGYHRRDFLRAMGLGAASLVAHGCVNTTNLFSGKAIKNKPNIILIMIDNVGFGEIGINGNNLIKTPNLDKFAHEGVQMTHFYCNPMCAPTRASLITGRYHYRTGVIHTSRGGAKMHGNEVTIAEYLKKAGYTTGVFGKWHLGDNYPMRPQDQGFDQTLVHKSGRLGQVPDKPNSYFDPTLWYNGKQVKKSGYCTDVFFDAAMDFISHRQNQPFFIYIPTNVAHTSTEVGLQVHPKYSQPYKALGLDDNVATIYGMITNVDENFGRLIARLDTLNLRKNTLVVFLSDDGNVSVNTAGFRGQGQPSLYEGGLRVPCFAQWPGRFPKGLRIDHIASHIDILPTLLAACNLEIPSRPIIDGINLMPSLEGRADNWPDRMLFFQCHRGLTPQRYQNCAVVTQRYKMVGYPGTFAQRKLKTSMEHPVLELYDLAVDPGEKNDVAKQQPEILAKLRQAYDKWFDDVKSTRQFTPGYIHIGSDAENPTYLSRYQDSAYIDQKPTGWLVNIERSGKYEFTINRGGSIKRGHMYVKLNNKKTSQPLKQGENKAIFSLDRCQTKLNVWIQEEGELYVPRPTEDTIGDVIVRRLTE